MDGVEPPLDSGDSGGAGPSRWSRADGFLAAVRSAQEQVVEWRDRSVAVAASDEHTICGPPAAAAAGAEGCLLSLVHGSGLVGLPAWTSEGATLTELGARRVSASARAQSLSGILFEYDREMASLVAFVALRSATQRSPAECATAADWCAAFRRLAEEQRADPGAWRRSLTCAVRLGGGVGSLGLRAAWPGTPCGWRGVRIGGACFDDRLSIADYDFRSRPIDQRLPASLGRFVTRLQARVGDDLRVTTVSLVGCHETRFERGALVKHLDQEARPHLGLQHVSEHAAGLACDVAAVGFRAGSGEGPVFAPAAYTLSLLDALQVSETGDEREERRALRQQTLALARKGIGMQFRTWERDLAAGRSFTPPQRAWQFRMGVLVRNAFVDAGLVVFDGSINSAHAGHFHVHLPSESGRARIMEDAVTTAAAREAAIEAEVRRAAGVR